MRRTVILAALAALGSPACAGAPPAPAGAAPAPARYRLTATPPSLQPAVDRADQAIGEVQKRLSRRLLEEMARGGASAAIIVCRDEAQPIAAAVAEDTGVAVGRTTDRLRNPKNAPRPWVKPFLDAAAGRKAAEVDAVVVDLGDRVGLLRPIPVKSTCLPCHGKAGEVSGPVRATLAAAYPADRSIGYSDGDLRGFFWAEAKR